MINIVKEKQKQLYNLSPYLDANDEMDDESWGYIFKSFNSKFI